MSALPPINVPHTVPVGGPALPVAEGLPMPVAVPVPAPVAEMQSAAAVPADGAMEPKVIALSSRIPRAPKLSDALKALQRYVRGGSQGVASRMADAVELLVSGSRYGADRADGFRGVRPTSPVETALDPFLGSFGFALYPAACAEIYEYTTLAAVQSELSPSDIVTAMSRCTSEAFPAGNLSPWMRENELIFISKQLARVASEKRDRGAQELNIDALVASVRERVVVVDSTSEPYTADIMPSPRENLGALAAGAKLGVGYLSTGSENARIKVASLDVELQMLKDAGCDTVVCLLEGPNEEEAALVLAKGMRWLPLQINDFAVPTLWEADFVVRGIVADLEAKKNVLVHCASGLGRTGTINACVLVRLGVDPEVAVAAIRKARPGSIETKEQVDFVFQYAKFIAGEGSGV